MTKQIAPLFVILFSLVCLPRTAQAQVSAASLAAFHDYTIRLEAQLDRQHRADSGFLRSPEQRGIRQVTPAGGLAVDGALLHHWSATTFLPGVRAAAFEHLLRNLDDYPRIFAPQILQAHVLSHNGSTVEAMLRVRQKHVLTVVLDTTYAIEFGRLDTQHGFSTSRSTRVQEIAAAGTPREQALSPSEEHGFLWAQNTYWSYAEQEDGLLVQVDSISLSRAIPAGLGWAVGPFVESIPRDSLRFTLDRIAAAVHP